MHDLGEWLSVRIYGHKMIRANNIHGLWDLLLKILERLKFSGARLELDKTVQLKLGGLRKESDALSWQKEGKGKGSRPIQIALDLKGNGGDLA